MIDAELPMNKEADDALLAKEMESHVSPVIAEWYFPEAQTGVGVGVGLISGGSTVVAVPSLQVVTT